MTGDVQHREGPGRPWAWLAAAAVFGSAYFPAARSQARAEVKQEMTREQKRPRRRLRPA
jgi:hypothetical protein